MFLIQVSKTRAAVVCVLCAITAIPFFMISGLEMFGGMFLVWSFIYGCLWLAKSNRDKRIVRQTVVAQPKQVEQPVTSSSSSRLFVPPPVDR